MPYEADKEWKYSTASIEPTNYSFTVGDRNLQITRASLRDEGSERERVVIFFRDLETKEEFPVTYNMIYAGKDGYTSVRKSSLVSLHSLKQALRGPDCGDGLLHPDLLVGGVVNAFISCSTSTSNPDRRFAQIQEYKPVPESLALINPKDQYFIPDEE